MHCHQHLVIHQLFVCSPFPSIRSLDISFRRVYVMNALEKFFVLSFMPVEVWWKMLIITIHYDGPMLPDEIRPWSFNDAIANDIRIHKFKCVPFEAAYRTSDSLAL
jgi:hypothetical protein